MALGALSLLYRVHLAHERGRLMTELIFIAAGAVLIVVFTVWFVWHGRYWAKRASRWDIPGVDK